VRGDDFVDVFRPGEVANLRAGIDALQRSVGGGVPKADASIGSTATRGEKAVLMRRPRDGFDGGLVLRQAQRRAAAGGGGGPNQELIIVPTTREFAIVVGPLQTAHL